MPPSKKSSFAAQADRELAKAILDAGASAKLPKEDLAAKVNAAGMKAKAPRDEPVIPPPLSPSKVSQSPYGGLEGLIADGLGQIASPAIDYMQEQSKYAMDSMLGQGLGAFIPGYGEGQPVSEEDRAKRLLAARAYKAFNPVMQGTVGSEALEGNPNAQRGALALENVDAAPFLREVIPGANYLPNFTAKLGPTGAAVSQFGAEVVPQIVTGLGLSGGEAKATSLLGRTAETFLRNTGANAVENAISEGLGAESGHRMEGAVQGATNPVNLLTGAMGSVHSVGADVRGGLHEMAALAGLRGEVAPSGPVNWTPETAPFLGHLTPEQMAQRQQHLGQELIPTDWNAVNLSDRIADAKRSGGPVDMEKIQAAEDRAQLPTNPGKMRKVAPPPDPLPSRLPDDEMATPTQPATWIDPIRRDPEGTAPRGAAGPRRPGDPEPIPAPGTDPAIPKVEREYRNTVRTVENDPSIPLEQANAPPPPKMLPPTVEVTPEMVDAVSLNDNLIRNERGVGFGGTLRKVGRGLLLPEFRTIEEAAAAIRGSKAAKLAGELVFNRVYPKLRKVYNSYDANTKGLVDRFVRQRQSPEDIDGKLGSQIPESALPPEWRAMWEQSTQANRAMRDDLIVAGAFPPEAVKRMAEMDGRNLAWLHRSYKNFLDKNYVPNTGLHQRTVQWLMKHHNLDEASATAHVFELLQGSGPINKRWTDSALNKDVVKTRGEIPGILRDLLGEAKDPSFVVASSMGELERLWSQHQVTKAFTSPDLQGKIWSPTPAPGMHPIAIPANKAEYGEFAGKYVNPQLFEALTYAPASKMRNIAQQMGSFISGPFRTSAITLNHLGYLRNWLSNSTNAGAAGLPLWHPKLVGRLVQSAKSLAAWEKSFLTPRGKGPKLEGFEKDAQWTQWAYEDSALQGGIGEEAGGQVGQAMAARILRDKKAGVGGHLQAGWDWWQEKKANLGAKYDMMDKHWRLAVYIQQVTRGVNKGLDIKVARARAAKMVNENFASSSSVAPGIRDIGRATGFLNPFMNFHADNIRVHGNWAWNAAKAVVGKGPVGSPFSGEGASQAFNVAAHYGLLTVGLGSLLKYTFGVTDPETEAAEASLTPGKKKFMPARTWLPIRDAKGRMQVVNMAPFLPTSTLFNGNQDSLLSRVGNNLVMGFAGGGAAGNEASSALQALGIGEEEYKRRPTARELQMGPARKVLEKSWELMQPGTVRNISEAARRAGVYDALKKQNEALSFLPGLEKNEEPYTPGQAIGRVLSPVRAEPVGAGSAKATKKADIQEYRNLKTEMRTVSKDKKKQLTPEERKSGREEMKAKAQEVKRRNQQKAKDRANGSK